MGGRIDGVARGCLKSSCRQAWLWVVGALKDFVLGMCHARDEAEITES